MNEIDKDDDNWKKKNRRRKERQRKRKQFRDNEGTDTVGLLIQRFNAQTTFRQVDG